MSVTVISDEVETPAETVENVSIERALGALENEVEHQTETVEEIAETVENIEQNLIWNSQEKQELWGAIQAIREQTEQIPPLVERVANLELLTIEEIEEMETEQETDKVEDDLENPIPAITEVQEPIQEKTKNPITMLLFGR